MSMDVFHNAVLCDNNQNKNFAKQILNIHNFISR